MADTGFDFFAPVSSSASAAGLAPKPSRFQDIFGDIPAEQLDPDPLGLVTEREGAKRGTGWTRDTVEGLNLYGQFVTADELRTLDGGLNLLDLVSRKRRGRRGFVEALTAGGFNADFIPYVGDLASTGIAIKNMSVVRDSLRKMAEQGPQALTLQEKVLTRLYSEDMERQSNQTLGGTVGTILRQAPAFAFEFLTTGAIARGASAAAGFGVKKAVKEAAERSVRQAAVKFAKEETAKKGIARAALSYTDDVLAKFGDDAVAAAGGAALPKLEQESVKNAAVATARATLEAYKNPSHLRNIGEFVAEYSKRGVFDHMDNVIRDLPPGVAGKLREAAGVALIEAPVKGGLYAAFDFLAVNPVAARLAGAPEAVTKTELGLYATGDKELMDNAKMLAFGTAWAEYASEVSGRAFTALGGIVTENLASGAGRAMARAGLRATRGDYVQEGSVAKRLFDYMQGTGAEMKTGLAALKNEAFEAASKSALPEFAGKSAGDIALDAKLADKAVKSYLGFRDKSFLGYLIANKALEKNITPQAVTKLYEAMGYDDILGEFMEERYNGFAQGLFGLDGQEHQSNLERIAHAFKSAAPDSFQQGLAEILAFSVPVMSRAAFAKAYDVLGAGAYGNARELGDSIDTFANAGRGVFVIGEKGGRVIDVKTSDAASGSDKASFTARAGRVEIKEPGMLIPMWNKMAGLLTDVSSRIDTADNGAPGFWREVGKRVLGITQFAITGNPMAALSDPVKATLGENLGGGGLQLVALARNMHRELYRSALTRRARESAEEMAGETKEERENRIAGSVAEVPESRFSDPEILAEIRPQMEDFSKFLIRDYLGRRGAHVMEESEMDAFADTLVARHAAPDGTVAGMTKDEFKKKYRDEIAAAAANRLTFDVMGDHVLTTYARPEAVTDEGTIGLMARSVEEYMARHNIASLVDGDSADPGGQFRAVSGTAMPEDLMMLAAGEGRERGDLEVDRARMELATRLYVAPNFADAASWKRMSGAVGDYARAILEINRTFLRPRFDLGDRSLEVAGTEGRFYLADTVTGARAEGARDFATVEETANDAAARLGAVRRPAEIYFTTNNTFFAKHASQLLSKDLGGSRGYMLGNRELHDALLRNPFMNPELTHQAARDLVAEDLRLSALWLNRKSVPFKTAGEEAAARAAYARSSADQAADPVSFAESGATEDGYETVAARAAKAAGIKEYGRPDARGKKGFVYEPAAISMDGAVYIPYRHLGSVTALVEDGVESVIKRNRKAFMSADDPRRYSPVVEAFFNDIQPLLTEIRDNARPSLTDASGNPLSTAESKRVRDEARFLSDLFDPGKYNIEALSHAYAGFVLMQADAARERGAVMGGSAYYATLGIIARQVRTSPAYPAFASLLNRAVAGSAVTPGPSALARMTSVFVPNRFLDNKSAPRDLAPGETGLTPVEFVGAMGDDIAKIAKTALGGMPLSGLKSATGTKEARAEQAYYARELALRIERQKQAADKGGNVREYYEEEYPYLLSEIKGERDQRLIEKSEAVVQAEEAAAIEPVPAAVENAAGRRGRDADDPNASSSSRAEDILFELPAVAISLGAEWLKLRPANPGDRRGKLDRVFDEWKRRDPLLSEASRQRFIDAVKKAGVWAPDKGEGHLTLSAQDEIIRLDDVFTQELGESDEGAETDGPVVETDDLENPDEAENGYDEGANAKRLADAPLPRVLRTVMHMRLPAALGNDQEALEMFAAESAALYPKGMKDPKSLASLFDEEMWTAGVLHPALADQEAFDAWLSEERPEKGIPLFDDMIAAFRVLGLDGVTRAADSLKGSTVKSVYTLNVRTDSTGRHSSVEFRRAVHSGSIDTADSLLRSLASDDPGKDAAAALKMLEAERGKTTDGRFARLAEAADLLFGKGNILSQTLRKKRVYDMSVAAVSGLSGESDRAMFTTWFVEARRSGAAEAWAPAGLLAEQMRLAAERAVKGDNAGAVRWLLRGDAVTMRDASNRGGVMTFLNRAAGTMDVTSRQRLGTNAGKVRAVDPSLSAGAKLFLKSPEFKAAYMAAGGKEEDFAADSRFARWPDGTPVFAATNGLRRTTSSASGKSYTSEVSQPAYDEVSDLAQLDFSSGKDAYARVAVYNSEKKLDRLVVIPRAALAGVTGKETPSYAETLASVARIMRVPYLSAKRGGHHMGSGEAAEKQNVTVALMLTEDKASQENLHGMGFIGDADLAGYYRRQGFGSAAKVILTESPVSGGRPFYAKGQFILADREPAEGEVLPAAKDLYRIASGYAYLSDKDSFKETPLYYKAADGSKRTLLDLVLAKDLSVDVTLPEGGTVKASDLAAELGVEAVAEKVNGAPVTLVTMRMGLRSQWASAPSKLAKPHHVDIPVNYMMDNKQSMMAVLRQARVRAALAARTAGTALGKVYEGLESTVRELLDAGVSPRDPGVLKTLGPKMASALTKAFRPTMMGQKYLNRNFFGARVVEASPGVPKLDADGRMVVSDPFGAMKALPGGVIHDTYELSPEESAEMDGATRRLASTACNLGGTTARYGMRAVASALGKDESDLAGIAAEVENRVKGLKTAELRSLADSDPSVYLRYYQEFIAPAFTDHNGNPMMPGQVVSFSDLVGKDGKFDRTRVYRVNEDGNVFVFLGGQLQISGRTPSYDGRRAEYAHSVAMPAYMEEADGTRKYTYTAVYVKRDGTLGVRHVPYPAGTLVPGRDAVVVMTPEAKYLAGSDEDWDTSHSQRLPTDAMGREIPELADAERLIAAAEDPRAAEAYAKDTAAAAGDPAALAKAQERFAAANDRYAESLADRAVSGLEATAFWGAIGVHRKYSRMMNPVTAAPFSAEHAATVPAEKKPALDTPEAAHEAWRNKEIGNVSRGIAVKSLCDLEAALDTGMRFDGPVNGGEPVAAGVSVGVDTNWSTARVRAFITAASGAANSTFDDLKEGLAFRAGFRPEFFDLYLYLAFESGATDMAGIEAFHTRFMEWMNGPEGSAVTKAYRNEAYPAKNGGSALARALRDTTEALMLAAEEESIYEKSYFHYRMFRSLPMPHRRMVAAVVNAVGVADPKDATPYAKAMDGFEKAFGLVQTLYRMKQISAVGTVLAHKKSSLSAPGRVTSLENAVKTVTDLFDDDTVRFSATGRALLTEARDSALQMVDEARRAFAGSVELSAAVEAAKTLPVSPASQAAAGTRSVMEMMKLSVSRRLPFEAAAMLTPRSTGAVITRLLNGVPDKERTARFLGFTETALRSLYREYAYASGEPNAALDALVAPSPASGVTRISMTGSEGSADVSGNIRAAMEAMRDWTASGSRLPAVTVKAADGSDVYVTPADFYWMLLQYSALTSGLTVESGRVSQSLIRAFYGTGMYKNLSDYAVERLENQTGLERMLHFTVSGTDESRKFPLDRIPDAFGDKTPLAFGMYDAAMAKLRREKAPAADATLPAEPAEDMPLPPEAKAPETVEADAAPDSDADMLALTKYLVRATPEERTAVEALVKAHLAAPVDGEEDSLFDREAGFTGEGGETWWDDKEVVDAYWKHRATLLPLVEEMWKAHESGALADFVSLADALLQTLSLRPETGSERAAAERARGQGDLFLDRVTAPAAPVNRVVLPTVSRYAAKDQAKSDRATKFIGRGSALSSTAAYAKAWGDRANSGSYLPSDVVFVSAEGNRSGRVAPDAAELGKAIAARVTFITDDRANRERSYNVGEREVAGLLSKSGYRETAPGVWAPAAPVNHTEESAAWLNARRWAKSAYGRYVGVNQRRLAAFARDAKAEAARMSDADAVQAADMGQALRKLAGLPWAAGIPGASDTLAAAERLLQSMRYPEPAVFMGAVRALGAAARAANAADALDQLTALYSEGSMDKAGSRVRLAALRDNAAVLAAPAPLRVMTFAVASTPEFSESKASSGTIAKQLLNGLGIGAAVRQAAPAAALFDTGLPPVNVWHGSGENAALSNLALRPFEFNAVRYLSVEHAYQTLKSGGFDKATYDAYLKYPNAGVKIPGKLPADTAGGRNIRLMRELVRESFRANSKAREALMDTGYAPITHTQDSGVWRTEFPKILMDLRNDLIVEFRPIVLDAGPTASLAAAYNNWAFNETSGVAQKSELFDEMKSFRDEVLSKAMTVNDVKRIMAGAKKYPKLVAAMVREAEWLADAEGNLPWEKSRGMPKGEWLQYRDYIVETRGEGLTPEEWEERTGVAAAPAETEASVRKPVSLADMLPGHGAAVGFAPGREETLIQGELDFGGTEAKNKGLDVREALREAVAKSNAIEARRTLGLTQDERDLQREATIEATVLQNAQHFRRTTADLEESGVLAPIPLLHGSRVEAEKTGLKYFLLADQQSSDLCNYTSSAIAHKLLASGFPAWKMGFGIPFSHKNVSGRSRMVHYVAVTLVDGKLYIVDQPQSEFTDVLGEGQDLTVVAEYKPRLIPATPEGVKAAYGKTDSLRSPQHGEFVLPTIERQVWEFPSGLASEFAYPWMFPSGEKAVEMAKLLRGQGELDFGEPAAPVSEDAAAAEAVQTMSASLYEDNPLGITDEEIELYASQPDPRVLSDDLQRKLAKRLEALIPPMPDEFESDSKESILKKLPDGQYEITSYIDGDKYTVSAEEAKKIWGLAYGDSHSSGDFALVAQVLEDHKRDNGIVYDPNDAYSRGEGFYHDIGAFNPQAPGLLRVLAKVLLAQEKKRRAGDLRYWEDTANQLVVSAYTSRAPQPPSYLYEVSLRSADYKTTWSKRLTEAGLREILAGRSDVDAVIKRVDEKSKDEYARGWEYFSSAEGSARLYGREAFITSVRRVEDLAQLKTAPVRPGSGLRFVIRPSSQNILWAAKGDVYSGTVQKWKPLDSLSVTQFVSEGANYWVERYADPGSSEETNHWITDRDGEPNEISFPEYSAAYDKAEAPTQVDPKAPAAEKLSLLSHTVADAIEGRRPQNYNELGVRLALGNFYIEGEDSELPKELRRLNRHLKRAFIAVHGSLDPVAPYTPKTVPRAAGPVSASMADYEANLLDLVKRADAEIRNLTGESEARAYLFAAHPDDKIKRGQAVSPESVAARMPVYMEGGRDALNRVASHVAAAAAEIENMTGLGPARDAILDALNVFFMPGTGRSAVKPFHTFAGKRYGEFMRETGLTVRAARAALLARRRSLADLPEDARAASEAALDEAERSFLSAWHLGRSAAVALRPHVNRAANPLRALFDVAEERLDPPEGVEVRIPTREEAAVSVSVLDPETGHPDPLDDFNVTFVDSDAWFYGTVFPVFRGADIRQILFDKEPLSIVANAYAVANRFEAYFGLDSETGSLRKIRNVKGLGHHLKDGGYVYDEASAADVEVMGRRKIIREQADIVSGNAFTDAEFELARWFGGAVYSYLGDGGAKARQATAGTVEFDLPWAEIARMKPEERQTFVSFAEAARRNGNPEARMYSIHHLLLRAQSSIPAELHGRVEAALQEAVARGAMSPRGTEAQAAYAELARSGYAVARRRRAGGVPGDYYDVRLAVPVSATAEVFAASSARDKLIRNGRQAGQLTMEAAASQIREAFERVEKSQAALPWAVYGAAGGISDAGTAAPFFKGSGAYKYFARKLRPPETPAYRDAVLKEYESLRETLKRVRGSDGKFMPGERAASNERFARMFALLRDLHPQMFGKDADARGVWETVRHGGASSIGLNAESTAWDIAKAIYSASVARLHDSAWNDGAATLLSVQSVGLEAFNRAIGEAAIELNEPLNLRGATFSDIYDSTGALPQNLTAGEALALHARETAEAARYRLTLNQLLMTADEDGRPLVYARPGANAADDTVPDAMWQNLARWWAETNTDSRGNGVSYDEARSGRENAIRLYDLVTAGKVGDGAKQTPTGGVMRYTMTRVDVPPGMETFSAVSAAKDKAGDDTKATLNAFGGGEAANITRQVLAIGGYGRPDARLAQMNRALSWSKSASVMASVFFPIATAFESPAAAVGMGATLFGLTGYGAGAARWLKDNRGWIAKAVGVDDVGKAPFMADILRVIGSDDPALVDLKIHATLAGLSLADRAKNMMDTDRTVIAQDIKAITAKVRALRGVKAAKSVKALLEGAMEHSSEFAFEYVINATKLAVFAQMNERLRQKAVAAGRWWDPVRDMKKWANYINSEVGGIDPAMYPWMTPQMQQALKALMFSWEWTLGAWEAGGGGVLTQKLFGQTTPAAVRKFMFGRWVRMYGSVMIGIPLFMQMLGVAVAKVAGDDDDDDRWFTWQNERSKQWKDFDVTPLLRAIANTHLILFTEIGPTWGDIKRKEIPIISALIPALTGQEGDKPTTRRRRYYMHLGKQGWEVAGWFENPAKSFLSKMSMPAQKILEGVLGITPSMGWETPFSEMGFWERWTSLDPEKSALLNLGSAFLPFSVMGIQRAPEIGALSAVAPAGKGISKTRAENEMAAMFQAWGDAETYAAMAKGRPGAWTDLTAMSTEWLEALRLNGYDPETSLKNALAKARRPLYEKIHMALPAFPDGKADTRELEKAARGLYRLDFVAKNLRKSIKARDKQQHINRTGDFRDSTDALLRDAFENPYGRKADGRLRRSAAGGGDVRKLLAGDKVPRTVLGYRVLKTEELSESDLAFFRDNPESPGFFDKETK